MRVPYPHLKPRRTRKYLQNTQTYRYCKFKKTLNFENFKFISCYPAHTYTHIYIQINTILHLHLSLHTPLLAHIHIHTRRHAHTHVHTHTHIRIHTHTIALTHTCACTYTPRITYKASYISGCQLEL